MFETATCKFNDQKNRFFEFEDRIYNKVISTSLIVTEVNHLQMFHVTLYPMTLSCENSSAG